ncbi:MULTISPECIES: hypothetical protein [unclassified Leclercia]|jgi:hypothetical protein|uniref:hypothetical protein n=1 Tax=unclassified Leclercia TaxID=2627398 RepID=UPI001CE47B4A|nr:MULTISPECIES: hypothetical protein [unclassified Leclercia]MDY0922442.1 hypothetical protein [Leclercia sp. CFBP8987]
MIKNLTPNDQLSVSFIKWGEGALFKGDSVRLTCQVRLRENPPESRKSIDIKVLIKWHQKCRYSFLLPILVAAEFPF